jgi:hypothetical protein
VCQQTLPLHTTAADAVIAEDARMAALAVALRSTFITEVITRTSLFAVPNQRHSARDGSGGTSIQFRRFPTMERRAGGVIGASAKKTKNKIARDEKSRPHLSLVAGMAELSQGFVEVIGR